MLIGFKQLINFIEIKLINEHQIKSLSFRSTEKIFAGGTIYFIKKHRYFQ